MKALQRRRAKLGRELGRRERERRVSRLLKRRLRPGQRFRDGTYRNPVDLPTLLASLLRGKAMSVAEAAAARKAGYSRASAK